MGIRRRERTERVVLYVGYILVTLFFMFPLLWVLSLSLKSIPEIFSYPPVWFSKNPQFENYKFVLEKTEILGQMRNSAYIVLFTVILTLIVAVPAAYGLSRFKYRSKSFLMLIILMFQMISPVIVAIPLYRLFAQTGMINQHWSLILVYTAIELPFATWFLKGYLDTITPELDEAARIDGCSRWQTIRKVLVPVCMPGIVSVMILVAVQSWSQFVIPFILLDDKALYPVSVGLLNLQSTSESITMHYLAASSVISILPVIVVFVVLQRFIVGALTSGAVKG